MPERPNLSDVAAAAGVSKSTAQRVLAYDSRCAEKTRTKVLRVATEMGYVPDPVFAAVGARRRSKNRKDAAPLAYLVAQTKPGKPSGGANYFPHCKARAEALGYKLELINIAKLESPQRLWQILYAKGYVGILVGSVRQEFHEILLTNNLFPTVCVGRLDPLPYHTIRPSIQAGVRVVWQQVVSRGYKRIGAAIFRHDPVLEDDFSRFSTIIGSQLTDFPQNEPIPSLVCDFDEKDGFIPWIKRYKPDAVIGFHDGLLDLLKNAGYRIPDDIGFATLHRKSSKVCGLNEDVETCAASAVNFLDQIIRLGERGIPKTPINLMIESKWIDGDTLRRKRVRKKTPSTSK